MRAAGLEPDVEQGVPVEQALDLEVRDRLARRVGVERVARRLPPVAADRRLDSPGPGARPPADERLVPALELPRSHQLLQLHIRLLTAGHDEQARGVAVEPVDDARPFFVLPTRGQPDEPVHERAARMARRRMDDDARRLVDDQDVLVLPGDTERHVLVLQLMGNGLRDGQLELLAAFEPVRLRPPLAVDDRRAFLHQPLGRGTGADLGQRREEAIEPLARGLGGNGDSQRVSPLSNARNRIATPPSMKLSARLKAGQYLRSRKSVTWPSRMRSIRFEVEPPISRPSATGSTGCRAPERAK